MLGQIVSETVANRGAASDEVKAATVRFFSGEHSAVFLFGCYIGMPCRLFLHTID